MIASPAWQAAGIYISSSESTIATTFGGVNAMENLPGRYGRELAEERLGNIFNNINVGIAYVALS